MFNTRTFISIERHIEQVPFTWYRTMVTTPEGEKTKTLPFTNSLSNAIIY